MHKSAMTVLAAMAAANLWAIQGTLVTETETLTGDIKWQARNKQYVVSVKKGKTLLDMERKLADVTSLEIARPEALDKAIAQVDGGQPAAAVPVLTKIVQDYRMLKWDRLAGRYLVFAYLASGNADKAAAAAQTIISEDRTAAYSGELAPAYWQALLKLGKNEQLEGLLKKAATSGDRASSAAALVMRGDIIVAASNDAPEKLKDALRDGYLRVVLMYQDAPCAGVRAEACLKAAQCFDKLGQSARAEKLRQQAKAM